MEYLSGEKRDQILTTFGSRMRSLRLEKGWSQETLAEKTGLHRTYIGSVERAERNICLINIYIISEALEISVKDLMQDV